MLNLYSGLTCIRIPSIGGSNFAGQKFVLTYNRKEDFLLQENTCFPAKNNVFLSSDSASIDHNSQYSCDKSLMSMNYT